MLSALQNSDILTPPLCFSSLAQMAEAARTTRHYVSDSLAERYPYDGSKGFAGARQRDVGAVFNGYDALGIANLMNSLTDSSVSDEGKAKAAHHLYSRSASQETKIEMLQHGIVPILAATLNSATDVLLRHQCLLLLRSLAVLPQGCFALVFEGAIAPTVKALRSDAFAQDTATTSTDEEAVRCREAAAHVLVQVSSNMSGMRWLLGLSHETTVAGLTADGSVTPLQPEALMQDVVGVLAPEEHLSPKAAGFLLQAVAQLTSLPRGVAALLTVPSALPTITAYLQLLLPRLPTAPAAELTLGEAALEVMWSVALDRAGETAIEAAGVPQTLFDVFAAVCADPSAPSVSLQRQLTGALSAVHQLNSVKTAGTESLSSSSTSADGGVSRVVAVIHYLRHWNGVVNTQYAKEGKPVPSGVVAIVKNTVQCVRLASEVKAVRDATHALLNALAESDAAEAFHLRHQLYYHTKWEAEYNAGMEK